MKGNDKPISQWTKEECFTEVERLGCRNATGLNKVSQVLYNRMRKLGCIKEYPWESYKDMTKPISQWTKEECFTEVERLGCRNATELRKKCAGVANRMVKTGWIKEYPWGDYLDRSHPINEWTKDECFTEVKRLGCKKVIELQCINQPLYNRMRLQGWIDEYPWESYRKNTSTITVINSFIENIDFWDALTIPEILGLASAFGSQSLMNKLLKKLAKSGEGSEERKFALDSIKEMADMSEDEALEEINKDENDEVKENDRIEEIVKAAENMPSDEVEYTNELERIGKVITGMERLQGNKDIMNIINSGDVIKTLKDSITKRILLLSFEHPTVFDELEQKYCR